MQTLQQSHNQRPNGTGSKQSRKSIKLSSTKAAGNDQNNLAF